MGFVRRRQLVFSMVLFWVAFHRRKTSAWGGLLSNERVRGFPSLLLNAKCVCCYLNCLAFFFFFFLRVVILGRRFVLSKMEKKKNVHFIRVWIIKWQITKCGISQGVLTVCSVEVTCLEVSVRCCLFSPVCVTLEEFFACSCRETFWVMGFLPFFKLENAPWRKKYWWSNSLLKFRI